MITEETLSTLENEIDSLLHILERINDDGLPDDIEITGDSDDIQHFLDCISDLCNTITVSARALLQL